jgi:hypothetical protein
VNGAASSGHKVRPRPVADAPIDGLLERADELAKRWALALLAARPLEEIGRLPLAEIAATAPSLCASVLRALRSDDELELEGAPDGSAGGESAGSRRESLRLPWEDEPRELVAAVEALRRVLWGAIVRAAGAASLAAPSDRLLADLADRLPYVCTVVLTRSLPARAGAPAQAPRSRTDDAIRREERPGVETAVRRERAHEARSSAREPAVAPLRATVAGAGAGRSRAVLVDELSEPPTGARGPAGAGRGHATRAASASARVEQETAQDARPLPWDIPLGGADTELAREESTRRTGEIPSISIVRRRRPRERE